MANDKPTPSSKEHRELKKSKSEDDEVAEILAETPSTYNGKYKHDQSDDEVSETSSSDFGYGSCSPTPSETGPDFTTNDGRRTRRKRAHTAFTNEQIGKLENKFRERKYLSNIEREEFAEKTGLTEMQVKTWFQNRRMKWKRQRKDGDVVAPETPPKVSPPPSAFNPLRTVYSPPVLAAMPRPQPITPVRLQPAPTYSLVPMPYPPAVPLSSLSYHPISPMYTAYVPRMPGYGPPAYRLSGYPLPVPAPYGGVHYSI